MTTIILIIYNQHLFFFGGQVCQPDSKLINIFGYPEPFSQSDQTSDIFLNKAKQKMLEKRLHKPREQPRSLVEREGIHNQSNKDRLKN